MQGALEEPPQPSQILGYGETAYHITAGFWQECLEFEGVAQGGQSGWVSLPENIGAYTQAIQGFADETWTGFLNATCVGGNTA